MILMNSGLVATILEGSQQSHYAQQWLKQLHLPSLL